MTVFEAMKARRTIRKFKQDPIPDDVLINCVDVARVAPCGGNMQSLRFWLIKDPEKVAGIFSFSKWGMHLPDGSGTPKEGETPVNWVLILHDKTVKENPTTLDVGAAVENILIYAQSEGVGSAWLENLRRPEISELLGIPENLQLLTAVALGYPDIAPVEVPIPPSGKTPYYYDEDGVFCVPKQSMDVVLTVV